MLGMGLQGRQRNGADRSMLRAALYYRVSTEEQVEGYSLDVQAHAAKLYRKAHGWVVVEEYRDEGKSARPSQPCSLTPRPTALM